MGYQVSQLVQESTYNVYNATGATLDVFLSSDNAVTVLPEPEFWEIRDAGVGNRPVARNVGRTGVGGDVQFYVFPSQIQQLANLVTLSGAAPCYDLPSFSLNRGIYLEQGCARADRRYTGCKFGSVTFSADNSAQGCLFMFKGTVLGNTPVAITDTDLPLIPLTAYPTEDPFEFFQTAGKLVIGGVRTNYQNLSLTIANNLVGFPNETRYLGAIGWEGRTVTLSTKLLLTSPADRLTYEAGTKFATNFTIDSGVTKVKFDLGTNSLFTKVGDVLPLGNFYTQDVEVMALMDRTMTPPNDLVITVAQD